MIELNLDSTSLGDANCLLNFIRTTIGEVDMPQDGGYKSLMGASAIYGVGIHKFADTMFKTKGNYKVAKQEAERAFNVPKKNDEKKMYLSDPIHFMRSCFNHWELSICEDHTLEVLIVPQNCWWCDGRGYGPRVLPELHNTLPVCTHCKGTGKTEGPATEITFRIPFYEDAFLKVYLCGTIDTIGKIVNGCFVIRDFKTTSQSDPIKYLRQYELSRQLRLYALACKIMARLEPESILGRVGATTLGARIDGVFIKSKPMENEYHNSPVFQFKNEELESFEKQLLNFCKRISLAIQNNDFPREGILNGTCIKPYATCRFWNACKIGEWNNPVSRLILQQSFQRKHYNPLNFNE